MRTFDWVTNNQQLQQLCTEWQQLSFVVLDTEFVRVNTYYPHIGLIQLGTASGNYLLDPLLIDDWQPFADLLDNRAVTKVVHACGEDLEVFQRLTGTVPQPLYDTQLAAAYANLGFSWGYARLVEHFLQIALPKGATRSDWLQRPLTDEQQLYAVQDVSYLAKVYPLLDELLSEQKRNWMLEDGAALVAAQLQSIEFEELWRGAKLAWTLSPRQTAVLRELYAWRERQAQKRDIPRNWMLKEHVLLELAQQQPTSMVELERIEGLSQGQLRRNGQELLAKVAAGRSLPEAELPQPMPEPLPLEAGRAVKRLRKVGERFAAEQEIAPELVLKKKILVEALASGWPHGPYRLPAALQGWRLEYLGDALQQALQEEAE